MDSVGATKTHQTRTAIKAVRVRLRFSLALAATALLLLALAPLASADTTISQAGEGAGQTRRPEGLALDTETGRLYVADKDNNRIDAFSPSGGFEMAFGWGVRDGKAELQSCGPAASPPSAECRSGLPGASAGEFGDSFGVYGAEDVAVDNDPTSPSHHDVYVLDKSLSQRGTFSRKQGYRVEKFDSEGHFLVTWGGGVITGGAKGTGNLTSGSREVAAVETTAKSFAVGQVINGAGIPAETTILAVGPGTITLSKAASASGTAVALSVAEGPGNVPTNEIDTAITGGGSPNFRLTTPDPSPSEAEIRTRQEIGPLLPIDATAAELQSALEALPNIGPGNVKVTAEKANGLEHEYTVEFTGARFADTNVLFEAAFGAGILNVIVTENGAGAAEICTAAIAPSCSAGIQGKGHGQFDEGAQLALGPGGSVYVADCVQSRSQEPCKDRLQKFEPSGAFVEELTLPQTQSAPQGLAVDSNGDFYLSVNEAIFKYDPAGNLIEQLPVGRELAALAVDASGDLFSTEREQSRFPVIAEYNSAGETLRRFGYGTLESRSEGLAPYQSASGDIYSAEGDNVIHRSFPAAGPIVVPAPCKTSFLGNSRAVLQAEVNPEGKPTTVHFQYVDQHSFETEGGFSSPNTKVTPESTSIGSDFFLHEASGEASLVPETEYRCRVVATNADAPAGVTGEEGTFTSLEPLEIGTTTVSAVGTEAATLNATVNPLGIHATGFFEYVEAATFEKDVAELGPGHGFDHASRAPGSGAGEEPINFGSGEAFKVGSAQISGLKPATAYRFRIVVTDDLIHPKEVPGPPAAFRTYGLETSGLPDNRAYELVSPGQKNSAEVATPGLSGGGFEDATIRIEAGAGSGEAITYTSFTSFANAPSAPAATNQYLSKRTPSGWVTESMSPLGRVLLNGFPPYSGFTPELGFAALKVDEPAQTADCPEGHSNLYLRDNATGALHCLTPEVPTGKNDCFAFAGASEDGSHAFFGAANVYAGAQAGAEPGQDLNLYEWSAAKGLQVVNVLPGQSSPAAPTIRTSFGDLGPVVGSCPGTAQRTLRHVVSADGETVFWTYAPELDASELMARINGEETIQLDALPTGQKKERPGSGAPGGGIFRAASADGSVVYFTDTSRLISGSKAEAGKPDLYRYELGAAEPLSDLSKGAAAGDIRGVVGAGDDGSYLYFVAGAVLSGEEEDAAGEKAVAGKDNLYLYHEGKTTFIATLAPSTQVDIGDQSDWESEPKFLTSHVSPDGKHVAFLSVEAQKLAGYDNTVVAGTHCQWNYLERDFDGSPLCPQAFVYDAEANTLTCASCNPSGARPLGPTLLPTWTNPYEGPRYLSEDGSKLFFESFDALTLGDENGKRDVYEFERVGHGSCNGENPAFDPATEGCHFLISSGKSSDESLLIDASLNGRDVFINTRSKLLGSDPNENYDLYDAREGGGFSEASQAPDCEGEACKGPASAPPVGSSPATRSFQGPGNVVEAPIKCKKGFVKKHGKCVKKPHHGRKQNSKKHKANHKQGAGR
jgi:hypothetical protein